MDPHAQAEVRSTRKVGLSIVVPVYRSEAMLATLVAEVQAVARSLKFQDSFELILVNDGSPDASWERIVELADAYGFVRGVCLMKNFGQHNAIMAGLRASRGEIVVLMDDDLQHAPSDIAQLVEALGRGADVCYTHYVHRQHAAWKRWGSWFNNAVATRLLKKPPGVYLSSFKALRRCVVDEILNYDGPFAYVDGLILDVTRSIVSVDIEHRPRLVGEGNYGLRKSVSLWLRMATSFSILPLRLASIFGFALSAISLLLGAAALLEKVLRPETQPGWASIIAAILFVGGCQLMCLGVLGEYLGRAYLKLNRKPQYAVRSVYPSPGPSSREKAD